MKRPKTNCSQLCETQPTYGLLLSNLEPSRLLSAMYSYPTHRSFTKYSDVCGPLHFRELGTRGLGLDNLCLIVSCLSKNIALGTGIDY